MNGGDIVSKSHGLTVASAVLKVNHHSQLSFQHPDRFQNPVSETKTGEVIMPGRFLGTVHAQQSTASCQEPSTHTHPDIQFQVPFRKRKRDSDKPAQPHRYEGTWYSTRHEVVSRHPLCDSMTTKTSRCSTTPQYARARR